MNDLNRDIEFEKAYHEAGHAVMAIALRIGIESATIDADDDSIAHVIPSPAIAESELAFVCVVDLAGAVAASLRRVAFGESGADVIGAGQDFANVNLIANLIENENKRAKFIGDAIDLTIQLVIQYWHTIDLMARVLLVRRTISGAEAQTIFDFVVSTKERTSNHEPSDD